MNVLEFENVRRAYRRDEEVLAGVGFSLRPGEVVGLLGRNGAGKTTLIRLALGLLEPQGGAVRVFGMDPRRDPEAVKRRIGYVAEDQVLPDYMKVEEVVALHRDLFPTWDGALERDLRETFSIAPGKRVKELSKGQARQVALLCAVCHRPELLLLDEPAGGLDPAVRREFLETSIRMLNETGTAILFSSHYMTDVERLAPRVVMIHEGRVFLDTEVDELREQFSLALLPPRDAEAETRVRALEGCVSVRPRDGALHALFRRPPQAAKALIAEHLGETGVNCRSIPLEEMFIEISGGKH